MRKLFGLCVLSAGLFWLSPALAKVQIDIDLTNQTMHVESADSTYDWPISSARRGYMTPDGTYSPTSLQVMHYSHKYHMSPMPHAIFFDGGYAIHGTYETGWLGHPASHGCVRISPENAAILFDLVKEEGATIHITGTPPATGYFAARRHHRSYAAQAPGYSPYYYTSSDDNDGDDDTSSPGQDFWGSFGPFGQ